MYWMHGFGLGGLFFGGLLMLLFWVVVIVLAVLAIRAFTRSGAGRTAGPVTATGPASDQALEILRERYARGEITQAEYDNMRRDLTT